MAMIVVAEDDDDVREIIAYILGRQGHTVLATSDGAAALLAIRRHRPAAVVSDIDMPNMSGIELCRAVRADPEVADTPVVLVSGSLMPGDERPYQAGPNAVLSKPFKSRDLVTALDAALSADRVGKS